MTYPEKIQKYLKKNGIEVGDFVRVSKGKSRYDGILMPRIEFGDVNSIVIKLDNGYNIGIRFSKDVKIELIKKGSPIEFKSAKLEIEKIPEKPEVSILGTGGTLASRVEYRTGAVFPAFSPADFLLSFPDLKEIANINGRKIFELFSEDITPYHWKIIAREVVKEIKKKVDGIVLMHGTDTMHYTSAAISFMVQNLPIPVVFVGSQRSSDRGSSDNAMNLLSAVITAAKSDIAEVSVCMHGTSSDDFCYVHQGTKVRKMHTSRRDTFRSINVLPFAKVWYLERRIEYLRNDFKKRGSREVKLDDRINPNVALIYSHPGIKPEFIENLAKFYDGVVIAGTGLGHVSTNPTNNKLCKSLVPSLKRLIDSGIPVVIAPQTIYGRINLNVYTAGRLLKKIGVIGHNCDWTPEAALCKLMWVLGKTKNMEKIRKMMLENIAGEISNRSIVEAFLI